MANRPTTIVCYICGREFGSRSINIHEPQCIKKWHNENSQLPKDQRRRPPVKPQMLPNLGTSDSGDMERFNEAAWQAAQSNLAPCKNCGRTFNPDRLPVHLKSCHPGKPLKPLNKATMNGPSTSYNGTPEMNGRPKSRPGTVTLENPKILNTTSRIDVGATPMPMTSRPGTNTPGRATPGTSRALRTAGGGRQNSATAPPPPSSNPYGPPTPYKKPAKRRPQFVVCYICGREFTHSSLPIHEPQCLDKWKMENNRLPREMRRPPPNKPVMVPLSGSASGSYNLDEANLAAMEAAKANLAECRNCGRKFAQDRIQTHERICIKTGVVPSLRKSSAPVGGPRATSLIRANKEHNAVGNRPSNTSMASASSSPSATSTNTNVSSNAASLDPPKTPGRAPGMKFCYMCGKQFPEAALQGHLASCIKKFDNENQEQNGDAGAARSVDF